MRLNVTMAEDLGNHLGNLAKATDTTEVDLVRKAIVSVYPLFEFMITETEPVLLKRRDSGILFVGKHSEEDKLIFHSCEATEDQRDISRIKQQFVCRKVIADRFFQGTQFPKEDKLPDEWRHYRRVYDRFVDGSFRAVKEKGTDRFAVVLLPFFAGHLKADIFRLAAEQWHMTADELSLIFAPNLDL